MLLLLVSSSRADFIASNRHVNAKGPISGPLIPRKVDAKFLNGFASQSINVFAGYSQEPAPMGLADYGLGPSGAYEYSTNSSLGSASILSLSTKNSTGSPWMTFQLNVNLQFSNDGKVYVYWVQDVATLDTANNEVYFENNVWNSSVPSGSMEAGAISGDGHVVGSGNQTFYGAVANPSLPGNFVYLAYPASLNLRVNSSVSASRQPTVTFEYNDGYGWQEYDSVAFDSVHDLTAMSGFVVDGFGYNPAGVYYDSELILGGPGGGSQTTDVQSDVHLQLEYWNGHNYQLVTNAYDFGGDTAEGIESALSQWFYFPSDGGVIAQIQSGAGTLGKLWDQSGVGIVDLRTSLASGTLDVTNSSDVGGTPGEYPFTGGEVTVTLEPGTYSLQVYSGASLFTAGKYTLNAGQLLELRTPLGIIPLTLSYSIVGGGSGYSPPTLTYTSNGALETAPLGASPTVFDLDSGSTWTVTTQLPGSSGTERWQTSQSTTGAAATASTESITYYHQYLETFSYSVVGGGSGYSTPSLSAQEFGGTVSLPLGSSPSPYWLDSDTAYSTTNPLVGSSSTERWFAAASQGTVTISNSPTISYSNQFYLTLAGGSVQSQWYDNGAEAVVSEPDVYGRSSGTGQRLASYNLDSGGESQVIPTLGNVTVSVVMNAPHAISFTSVTQYEVSLGPSLAQALASITPPTITGDDYWYDSGSKVSVALDGTWGRSAGEGDRLVSYSINAGAQVPVNLTGTVTALSLPGISSRQVVSAVTTAQFFINTSAGSLVSITPTPIAGDAGWYDSQTAVTATYNYTWNAVAGESRTNAISYSVDAGQTSLLEREGSGSFMVSVAANQPHAIDVSSVGQYSFTYSGGFNVTLSSQSPTGDGFYDANSSTTATSGYIGDVVPNHQREALTGYTLDSATENVTRSESGTFTTPTVVFNSYHTLTFQSVQQYFVAFAFKDAPGSTSVIPSAFEIDESVLGQQEVPTFSLWADNGTTFTVSSVTWEGVDVKPLSISNYDVRAPENVTIDSRIYPASIKVTDLFGLPVQGAKVAAKLVNGTTATSVTNSSGLASLGLIPIGTYQGTVSYLGVSSSTSADASIRSESATTVYVSIPVLGAISIVAAIAVGAFLIRRRSGSKQAQSTKQ
ncbi:MAG: thermopsin family protease [Thaumarchaeota archaeon]|nr:thermopsin family protease [Nitrososphaerota archaeon]